MISATIKAKYKKAAKLIKPGLYLNEQNGICFELEHYSNKGIQVKYLDLLGERVTYYDPPKELLVQPNIVYIGEV